MAGDSETGITIMRMDEGLDTGPILAQRAIPIAPEETASSLHDKLASLAGDFLLDVLLEQCRRREFNPEEINFHWLVWHASHYGLALEDSAQNPEVGFYYQLYRSGKTGGA